MLQGQRVGTQQTELSGIEIAFSEVNERTDSLINELMSGLNRLKPYQERESIEKNNGVPQKIEEICLVHSLRVQVQCANQNADRLSIIVSHLNTLI